MKAPTRHRLPIFLAVSLCGYGLMGYGINRSNFPAVIAIFALLFLCYFGCLKLFGSASKIEEAPLVSEEGVGEVKTKVFQRPLPRLIAAAIVFRIVLIFALPTLSDDFYRFIWDGRLLAHGINPFAHTPQFYMQHGLPDFLTPSLFQHLNSQPYFTVYPPVSQYIYGLGAALFGAHVRGNMAVMKTVMAAAEIGSFWVMKKLLDHFELPAKYMLIYALNPLIILELTGNLHFEGVMIFFLLLSFYLLLKKRFWLGAIAFTLAVNTKLIPLIVLPYLVFSLGWKRSAQIIGVLIAGTALLFIPFLDHTFFAHFGDSLGLYFHSFEYNASIFYLVRWIGFQVKGYDVIHFAAPVLSLISAALILGISWVNRRESLKNLPVIYIVGLAIYYLFSTTVHPWYVTSLVAFVPLAGLWFPLAWSVLIPLTYSTYITPAYHQNYWLIAVEYIIVFGVMGYDLYCKKQSIKQRLQRIMA